MASVSARMNNLLHNHSAVTAVIQKSQFSHPVLWEKLKCYFHCKSHCQNMSQKRSSYMAAANVDPLQAQQLNDSCILVDENDQVVGSDTKRNCHYIVDNPKGILHRAFSVFLFNSNNEMLMQRRSQAKITFPGYFTNACCSHPSHSPEEMEELDAIGVKRAAQRRLAVELGIPREQIPLDDFHFLTRIHYCSPSDGEWGEHEIDYILVVKRNVTVNGNANEVMDYCFVRKDQLHNFIAQLAKDNIPITPWFRLIINNFLMHWWENLDDLESLKDPHTIHRLL